MYYHARGPPCCYDLFTCTHSYTTFIFFNTDEKRRTDSFTTHNKNSWRLVWPHISSVYVLPSPPPPTPTTLPSIQGTEYLFNACMRIRRGMVIYRSICHMACGECAGLCCFSPYILIFNYISLCIPIGDGDCESIISGRAIFFFLWSPHSSESNRKCKSNKIKARAHKEPWRRR